MSEDEADPELLALLAQSLGWGPKPEAPPSTGVLKSVEFVYDNALDVSISSQATKAAAELLYHQLQQRQYSTREWSKHELHPKPSGGEATINFIFTMNLLNFSFWSELPEPDRFCIEYNGKRWTGYWSLVAALQRAIDEGQSTPVPSLPTALQSRLKEVQKLTDFAHIFRSATAEPIPLLSERILVLRDASTIWSDPKTSPLQMITDAQNSAARLVNLLTTHLPTCFADTAHYNGKAVHLHKRAQILVADVWACFNGVFFGRFDDIDSALTMFADYRVPQMLQRLGVLWYSPRLEGRVRRGELLQSGEPLEVELRACSVWAVELMKREMARKGWDKWEAEVEVEVDQEDDGGEAHAESVIPAEKAEVGGLFAAEQTIPSAQSSSQEDDVKVAASIDADNHQEPSIAAPSEPTEVHIPAAEPAEAIPPPPDSEPISNIPSPSTTSPRPLSEPAATAPTQGPHEDEPQQHQRQQQPHQPDTLPTSSEKTKTETKTITVHLNAILLDYLLYDVAKEQEAQVLREEEAAAAAATGGQPSLDGPCVLPHHRTRSIWY